MLNVKAFKYLVNLGTLNIPTVSRDVVTDLCKTLEIIDIVHLTNETYDLSCFILTSGSSFDESTIRTGQTTLLTTDNEGSGNAKYLIFKIFFQTIQFDSITFVFFSFSHQRLIQNHRFVSTVNTKTDEASR